MTIKDTLIAQLSAVPTIPFLFVGSGVSRRYLGLETWSDLLRRFAAATGRPFEYYLSNADSDYPRLASILAKDYGDVWWRASEFEDNRQKYKAHIRKQDSPLKIEIATYMKQISEPNPALEHLRRELDLLRSVTIDGIITTNWDGLLESLFPSFKVFVGQDQLLFSESQSIAEIYKIHGCCSDPNTLVLTDHDYAEFQKRNPYLASKLLTIFVEHPIVFIGYSLTDPNILQILDSIAYCLTPAQLETLATRLFFVEWDPGEKGPPISRTIIRTGGKNVLATLIKSADFSPIYGALSAVKRRFPARMLRLMKEHVYQLVKTNDPKVRQYVQSFESIEGTKADYLYAGVGSTIDGTGDRGYKAITTNDLVKDVVFDERIYESERLLVDTLPRLLSGSAKWVPIFKYLRESNRIADTGAIATAKLVQRVQDRAVWVEQDKYFPQGTYVKKANEVASLGRNVKGVYERYREHDVWMTLLPLLHRDRVDVADLGQLLKEHHARIIAAKDSSKLSVFRQLVCFYDMLRWGPRPAHGKSIK